MEWSNDLNELADQILVWAEEKGFETPSSIKTPEERRFMMEKLMLVVTELSEAAEALRHDDHQNFAEELADTFIRLFHIAGGMELDVYEMIAMKMDINTGRPHKHGKEF